MNAATIELLVAKGLTAADLIEVARAMETRADPTNAVRQARHRAKRKSNGVTVTATPPPIEDILTPPKNYPTKPSGLEPKPKKHRLPIDWEPRPFKAGAMAALTVIRWEPGRMERELSKFRDHHTAAGSRFEDWQAAWSKWVNNSDDFQRGNHGRQHPPNAGKSAAAYAMLGGRPDEPF